MGSEHDIFEAVGAVVTGAGLVVLFIAGEAGLFFGPLLLVLGLIIWKMGEMGREFSEELESLRREIERLKAYGGTADG